MNELERFTDITTFIFDVDGVLTNSQLMILEDGGLLRQMNVRDGYAIKRALEKGYQVCVITGGKSQGVVSRLQGLGVVDIYYGVQDKVEAYREYMDLYDLDDENVLFMGDDVPDYEVMRLVGFPTCPQDACSEILSISKYVSDKCGGAGAVRDVIERTLRLHGKWLPDDPTDELPTSV
ncbi:3-deoxy-D-manno-octulosonate 8-phosphate phosphatase (KDO 8-P phosphatase) [Lewinella aquimaris]|uniref:3-deoxy-D-manno-octulosonate 8-phosphate phosphatase (KDO 8-P phosphatase) n=1 Tax=Neolewinella aquimaris TaxID=1835722 RepID=A0A840DX24_9BACT|nr:HAD hydrolase family protein [Neolewinella aquimaris]MBB4077490.1 3-deoxy-D-manno-octulosonate 8-phosphate phosphatase (KDO 8-P phosphatase) [Neolewinella aquimaris]